MKTNTLSILLIFIIFSFTACSKMGDRTAGGSAGNGTGILPETSTTTSNFNGSAIPAGKYIWFNAHFKATGITDGTVLTITDQTITSANSEMTNLNAPSSRIIFSSTVTSPNYVFDNVTNTWNISIPLSGSDEIFLGGLTFLSPGLPGGIKSLGWTSTFTSTTPNVNIQWQWGAAVYNTFSTGYNALNVALTHTSDHAGTPRTFAYSGNVYGGATGGAGSNYTGSWSATKSVTLN